MANPEMYWTAEGTAPTEFDTTGFIGEFNTNIHPCVGWMELGMDFLSDSPVAITDLIIGQYAKVAKVKLENAIASGSGTGEPLGLANTPGAVSGDAATAQEWNISDLENLLFAIPKEYRQEAGNKAVFVMNEGGYSTFRGTPVGPSDDRRIFGEGNLENYRLSGRSTRINHGIDDGTAFYACMNKYVMYRRAGFDVRRVTEDADLAKKNEEMLVVRMRYGGQFSDAAALSVCTDGAGSTP